MAAILLLQFIDTKARLTVSELADFNELMQYPNKTCGQAVA